MYPRQFRRTAQKCMTQRRIGFMERGNVQRAVIWQKHDFSDLRKCATHNDTLRRTRTFPRDQAEDVGHS